MTSLARPPVQGGSPISISTSPASLPAMAWRRPWTIALSPKQVTRRVIIVRGDPSEEPGFAEGLRGILIRSSLISNPAPIQEPLHLLMAVSTVLIFRQVKSAPMNSQTIMLAGMSRKSTTRLSTMTCRRVVA